MINVLYDDHGLSLNLEQAPKVTGLQLQKWVTLFVGHLQSAVLQNISSSGLIGRRTGNLARSIRGRITMQSNVVKGEVWPDRDKAIYGDIQEEGGTILPRKGRYLTIPLDAMLTANGVARGAAGDVWNNPIAYGFGSTFVHNSIIFGKTLGRWKRGEYTNSIIPLFALVPSVTLPGRHYMEITLRQELSWGLEKLEQITQEMAVLTFGGRL